MVLEANKDLKSDHLGFQDPVYRKRREEIVALTAKYDPLLKNFPQITYTQQEIKTWTTIFERLTRIYPNVACDSYLKNLNVLIQEKIFVKDQIPDLKLVSDFIESKTGFKLHPVSGLLSPKQFLIGLGNQTFYCTQYIRHHIHPFYTPEPDIVHEMLGHVPMFLDPDICEISMHIGNMAKSCSDDQIKNLEKLYWFTIEFGIFHDKKIYGAGILSSLLEIEKIESAIIAPFCLENIITDEPLITEIQNHYYSISSFDELKSLVLLIRF